MEKPDREEIRAEVERLLPVCGKRLAIIKDLKDGLTLEPVDIDETLNCFIKMLRLLRGLARDRYESEYIDRMQEPLFSLPVQLDSVLEDLIAAMMAVISHTKSVVGCDA